MDSWWVEYYGIVNEDTYFQEAYNSPAYGETYNSFVTMCRWNDVEVVNYLSAYPKYAARLEEEDPYFVNPLILRNKKTGKQFVGFFTGHRVHEIHDYDVQYMVI